MKKPLEKNLEDISMKNIWNGCVEIYRNGDFIEDLEIDIDRNIFNSFQAYCNLILEEPKLNVWYDTQTNRCFGPEQTYYKNPGDFSFFSLQDNFFTNPRWGEEHIKQYFGPALGTDYRKTSEYIIQNFEGFEKFKDKTILIIGGGPTTNEVDWQSKNIDYDYVWSCNNFFMREGIEDYEVSLASLGPTVDLNDSKLLDYITEYDTICAFEGGISPFRSHEELEKLKHRAPNQIGYYHLRYFSKVGTVARLICLATFLGVKKVYFVGMDGFPGRDGSKYTHAFEEKRYDGKQKTHGGRKFSFDIHRRQYVLLWDYLLNLVGEGGVAYQNLGEGHPANQSTDISTREFPLQV